MKVAVYELVRELEWVKYSVESAKKNAGMDFEFFGVGWNNPDETRDWLIEQGHFFMKFPETENNYENLYTGWRMGFEISDADIVVPIAGDMVFHKNWLKNLVAHSTPKNIVNCHLIERGALPSYHHCKDFGIPPNFRELDFQLYAKSLSRDSVQEIPEQLTAKPYACWRETYLQLGGEPKEIINGVTGDVFFIRKAMQNGVKMLRANNSIVYHFQRQAIKKDIGR